MVAKAGKTAAPLASSLAALGVVFGDIGTSPLYALSTSFELAHDQVDQVVVYGTTSMVIWAITLVVTMLYVGILLRFDNEGGRRIAGVARAPAAGTAVDPASVGRHGACGHRRGNVPR